MAALSIVSPTAHASSQQQPESLARLFREFLRSYPRECVDETLTFPGFDGREHTVTRQQCSAAIDRMRPRMRRVVTLHLEQGELRMAIAHETGYSLKSLERDQREALAILAAL